MTSQTYRSKYETGDWVEEDSDENEVIVYYSLNKKSEVNTRIRVTSGDDSVACDARCLYEVLKEYFEPNV